MITANNLKANQLLVKTASGEQQILSTVGTGIDGRHIFCLSKDMTALECHDKMTRSTGLVLKHHQSDDNMREVIRHVCPVCNRKPGKYIFKDQSFEAKINND